MDRLGRTWIKDHAVVLDQQLCAIAHADSAGYPGIETTYDNLATHVVWKSIIDDVDNFISKWLHCLLARGERCPIPYGETLRTTKPNESIYFDYL